MSTAVPSFSGRSSGSLPGSTTVHQVVTRWEYHAVNWRGITHLAGTRILLRDL